MRAYRSRFVLAGAFLLSATAAMAQPKSAPAGASPPTAVAPVTVEAAKPAELRKQTYDFVQTFAATSVKLDQLARWEQAVCVTVLGLPADAAKQVKDRVEEVAEALKVGVQPAGCKANIQIAFTDKPQRLLDKVAAEHEHLLGYWHHRDRDKLKAVTHPIQAWYVTGTGGDGGGTAGMTFATIISEGAAGSVGTQAKTGTAGRQPHGFQLDDEDNVGPGPTGCGANAHFTVCLTSEFQHVLVVVDTAKAKDFSPALIADYVVMVAMAQPKSLDGCNALPSVIDLFVQGCPGASGQDGLTRADVAYLTSLYKIDLQSKKMGQMDDIAGRMADMLIKAGASERLAIQAADTGKTGAR